ncbi:hypothetical protein FRB90_012760 [Tulasnella sp. 427]|nr:hypothetical protein FRB90_012760 [Tulasnella sp. 427]
MSLTSPLEIRTQLGSALGKAGLPYWNKLRDFLVGKLGRSEFEELVRQWINTPELVLLHNTLILSILHKASQPPVAESASAPVPNPPRKKRKLLPHQDPPPALSRWVLGMGKAERSRIQAASGKRPTPIVRSHTDELALERPVKTLAEGTSRAGTHVAMPLSTVTRTIPNLQQLSGRVDLIAAQHQMTASKQAVQLLAAGVEAFLKQLTVHALAATSSSHPFASITPSDPSPPQALTASSLNTLFTIAPFEIPAPNAAVTNLIVNVPDGEDDDDPLNAFPGMEKKMNTDQCQMARVLLSRSGIREALRETQSRHQRGLPAIRPRIAADGDTHMH